jgi:hypothetical protein
MALHPSDLIVQAQLGPYLMSVEVCVKFVNCTLQLQNIYTKWEVTEFSFKWCNGILLEMFANLFSWCETLLRDFGLLQQHCQGFVSLGIWCCVVGWVVPDLQSRKIFLDCFILNMDAVCSFVTNQSPNDTALNERRLLSWSFLAVSVCKMIKLCHTFIRKEGTD